MEKKYLMGLDAGGSGIRAGIFDREGRCISLVKMDNPPTINEEGWYYYESKKIRNATIESESLSGKQH